MTSELSEADLRTAVHEFEATRSVLAIIAIAPVAIMAVFFSVVTVLILPALVIAFLLVVGQIVQARLRGGAVEVSDENFPEIAADIALMSERLGYNKPVRAFVIQDGDINALLWCVFGRRFIGLNTGLVTSLTRTERQFIIARFIGALRARHLRFHEAVAIIGSLEKLKGLNPLVLPYIRTSVYTGDRFGALAIDDSRVAISAMNKALIGESLASELSLAGLTAQGRRLRASPFHPRDHLLVTPAHDRSLSGAAVLPRAWHPRIDAPAASPTDGCDPCLTSRMESSSRRP